MSAKEDYFGTEAEKPHEKRHLAVIIYDIPDNKQRLRMVKYLESFGRRVQKSAFEAWLTDQKFDKLCVGMDNIVHDEDHVKIYWLRGASETHVWGDPPNFDEEEVVII